VRFIFNFFYFGDSGQLDSELREAALERAFFEIKFSRRKRIDSEKRRRMKLEKNLLPDRNSVNYIIPFCDFGQPRYVFILFIFSISFYIHIYFS